ncbi:BTAD domain-containing putative transcriptional regulator [Pyxidicoccus xibeiensis]|uniref:BTAD domain-containing putative transcriptional regulator n=1 Tax=Pyxidicoccus xibeiensis TaxID=2906759 RepID=UPI0020A77D85|nr:BTAD domain-containing putative transcriptional regulator [Pyxidicoccus xibeiensis]MCP3138331.1 AAA family ATPase [Pyxidicoccus xibeiensis]
MARSSSGPGPWHLRLLGPAPMLEGPSGPVPLQPRPLLLLAYLALEGPTARARAAALLWPDSPARTARNNLVQLLRRLRALAGEAALVEGESVLMPAASLAVDVARVREAARAGDAAEVVRHPGGLLEGVVTPDSPELERWLEGARLALEAWRQRARVEVLAQLEAEGDLRAAQAVAEGWLQQDPSSEEAGRHLMRLLYLQGQRSAALEVYGVLRRTLAQALDAQPLPETEALGRVITQGAPLPVRVPGGVRRPLAPGLLRPPVLAGREEAWRALEEGWEAGQFLFLVGPAGVGKSRLATDFAESRGRWALLPGRVGDRDVPYSSLARSLRGWMAQQPQVTLPGWVRRELLRILPELGEPGERPSPLVDEAGRLRFYDAAAEAMALLLEGCDVMVAEDAHENDTASAAVGRYAYARHRARPSSARPGPGVARWLVTTRPGPESGADWHPLMHAMVEAGEARLVELGPLTPDAVRALLEGLGLPGVERHAEALAGYTGGNPLFVVETVKHLVETGAWEGGWPERLPPPGRVGPLLQRRLEQLSPRALALARVAALAGTAFSLEVAARVLEERPLPLSEAAAELEAAGVLREEGFSHDLLREAVVAAVPPALGRMLHGRLAEVLATRRVAPGVVAQHFMEAGLPGHAVPLLLRAAEADVEALLPGRAADLYARAAALLEAAGQGAAAATAREHEAACRRRATVRE